MQGFLGVINAIDRLSETHTVWQKIANVKVFIALINVQEDRSDMIETL